jgi:hypothetical protein
MDDFRPRLPVASIACESFAGCRARQITGSAETLTLTETLEQAAADNVTDR